MHSLTSTARRDLVFFFFQAEDGIRDLIVTGVQTCALPILDALRPRAGQEDGDAVGSAAPRETNLEAADLRGGDVADIRERSEERRVGKECRSRWSPYH